MLETREWEDESFLVHRFCDVIPLDRENLTDATSNRSTTAERMKQIQLDEGFFSAISIRVWL